MLKAITGIITTENLLADVLLCFSKGNLAEED